MGTVPYLSNPMVVYFLCSFWGRTFQTDSKNAWIKLYGLPGYTPEYNFVDGLWVGAKLSAGVKFSPASSLRFTPAVYYSHSPQIGSG